MRHWAALAAIIAVLGGALVWSEIRKFDATVGPQPVLNLIADSERELTRLPVAFVPLPDAEEIKIGKKLEKEYIPRWRQPEQEDQNRAIEDYVGQVGARVAAHAHRKLPYRFHYIPGLDFVNAFALPGGPVFIGGGLMALMDTEDELAAVLGHEIEHIDHYHCAERIQVQAALRKAPLGGLIALPVEIFVAGYSKNQELEADREGTKLAAAASYSPQGAVQMFEAFARLHPATNARAGTPQEELSDVARQTLEGYFRSHPSNAERIDQIRKMIAAGQLPAGSPAKPLALAYIFLAERGWRSLQAALAAPYPSLPEKEKRKREAERIKQYEEAAKLASQSLDQQPDHPRALEVLAIAKFALGDYAAATATYRKLLPDSPAFADGIRLYADSLAQQALRTEQYDKAIKLANASLELQPDQPDSLKILAEAQFQTSDFAGAADTCRKLQNMYPEAAEEVRNLAYRLATAAWAKHQYRQAASLAAQSLELQPDQRGPLHTLAQAQFALANFSDAAAAYRKLLELNAPDIELVRGYADSLSATSPSPNMPAEFAAWLNGASPASPALATESRVELAGLLLMTGNAMQANTIIAEAQGQNRNSIAHEALGRLGWWCYRAANYDMSRAVLRQAARNRPGDLSLQTSVAWNELNERRFDFAIRRFTSAAAAVTSWNSPIMGRAVARWQAHQTADALKDFESVTKTAPEWRNPRWVQALFPASVAQSVAEMDAEQQKLPSRAR
jgi:predicted Zn-dependent protease